MHRLHHRKLGLVAPLGLAVERETRENNGRRRKRPRVEMVGDERSTYVLQSIAYAGGEIYPIPTPRLDWLSLRGFNARLSSLVISLSSPSCDDTLSSTASLIVGRSRRHLKGDTPPVKMGIKVQVEWISHKGRMTSGAGTPILPNNSEWVTPP
jgi:hypothetical protein